MNQGARREHQGALQYMVNNTESDEIQVLQSSSGEDKLKTHFCTHIEQTFKFIGRLLIDLASEPEVPLT
jgi:hypothetical protein